MKKPCKGESHLPESQSQ